MYLSCLKFFLIGLLPLSLSGQDYVTASRLFTSADGLSHNSISHIYEDSRGLIWLSTRYGLNRFDGENFQAFTSQEYGFQSSVVSQTYEDTDGLLWVLNGKGGFFNTAYGEAVTFDLFDPISEQVLSAHEYLPASLISGIQSCEHYLQLPDKSLLFLDEDGWIYRYKDSYQYERYPFQAVGKIHAVKLLGHNQLALFRQDISHDAHNGVQIISISGASIKSVKDIRDGGYIGSGNLAITTTDPTQLWINYSPYEVDEIFIAQLLPSGEWVKTSAKDFLPEGMESKNWCLEFIDHQKDHYWFGRGEDLWVVDGQRNLINHFEQVDGSRYLLKANSGKYFASDQSSGLFSIDLNVSKFETIQLDKHSVRGICVSNNNLIWLGSEDSYLWLDTKAVTNRTKGPLPSNTHLLSNLSVYKNHEGVIFAGPNFQGETRIVSNVFASYYPLNSTSLSDRQDITLDTTINSYVWALWQDPISMNLWRADQNRDIYIYDLEQDHFKELEIPPAFKDINEGLIYFFFLDSKNHLWLCSSNGLYELNEERKFIARYWSKANGNEYLSANDFHHMHEDSAGVFWIATGNSGLIKWDQSKNEKHNYKSTDGLPSNVVHAVYPDDYGCLWLSTESGIARFHKRSGFIETYSLEDGISDMEFNRISHFKGDDDQIYFGGLNGVTIINPEHFNQPGRSSESIHLFPIELILRNSQNNQEFCGLTRLQNKGEIRMDRYSNNLEIQFLGGQIDQQGVFFESQIIGWQNKPTLIQSHQHHINNIPFGSYTLELTARDPDGEILKSISIPLNHPSPIYLQKWFMALALLAFASLVGLLIRDRTKRLKIKNALLENEVVIRTQQIEADRATIQKQAEELLEIDRLKSRFFANLSHELRTPISLIVGPLNQVLQDKNLSDLSRNKLANIQRHSNNILTLTNDLLELTKISAGKPETNPTPFQLVPTLNAAWSDYLLIAAQKNIDFKIEQYIENHIWIIADQRKVESIFKNLLSNAIKYTPAGGQVMFKSFLKDGYINIEISDTGPGIPIEQSNLIFDRFYRINSTQNPSIHGTGIGLAICKEFADLINGKVILKNNENKGSTFIFKFPLEEYTSDHKTNRSSKIIENRFFDLPNTAASKNHDHQIAKILIVEDNYELRNYLKEILINRFRVVVAENGSAALKCLSNDSPKDNLPQLIITDLSMPIMGGFELIEQLKENEKLALIPTIAVSAMANLDDRMRALRLGVDDYILKPFAEEELIQRIENLLQNAKVRATAIQRTAEILSEGTENQSILTKDEADCLTVNSEIAKDWLPKVEKAAIELISDPNNGVEELAKAVFVSKRTLSRKLKFHTGMPPNKYLLEIRLQQARMLLERSKPKSLKEIAFKVGIQKTSYFSKRFKERFGCSPVAYSNSVVDSVN